MSTRRHRRRARSVAAALLLAGLVAPGASPSAGVEEAEPAPVTMDEWVALTDEDGEAWTAQPLTGVSAVVGDDGDVHAWVVGLCPPREQLNEFGVPTDRCTGDAVVLATRDGGATWQPQASDTTTGLRPDGKPLGPHGGLWGVTFVDTRHGYAVGGSGSLGIGEISNQMILRTTDGGETWEAVFSADLGGSGHSAGNLVLRRIDCTDVLHCHAVGGAHKILATNDGGDTWKLQDNGNGVPPVVQDPALINLMGVSFTDGPGCDTQGAELGFRRGCYGHAIDYRGAIIATTDGGKTWEAQVPAPSLVGKTEGRDVFFTDHLTGWAVGGDILATTDGGRTWTPQASGGVNAVAFVDRHRGWVVGNDGQIQATTDGGATWTTQPSGTTQPLLDVTIAKDPVRGLAHVFAVGAGGTIVRRTTSLVPSTAPLRAVDCTDALRCHAVGGGSLLGDHVAGDVGTILVTVDGGRTWNHQRAPSRGVFFDVDFTDGPGCPPEYPVGCHGHAAGHSFNRQLLLATPDGGRTWVPQATTANGEAPVVGIHTAVAFADHRRGHIAGTGLTGGHFHAVTDDGGTVWNDQPLPVVNSPIEAIDVTDEQHVHLLGMDAETGGWYVLRTSDGGANWLPGVALAETSESSNEFLRDISFTDGPGCPPEYPRGCHGHAVGAADGNPLVLVTSDGGDTWTEQAVPDDSDTLFSLLGVAFADHRTGVAVGTRGGRGVMLITSDGGATWALSEPAGTEVLEAVSLTKDRVTQVISGFAVGKGGAIRKIVLPPPPGTVLPPFLEAIDPASGSAVGGTAVTLTGANLAGATQVRFGDTPVTPTSAAATEVRAVAPPHDAGEVPVTVTTPGGTSSPVTFTYVVPPPPTLTGIDPARGPTAGGTTVTLTGADLAGASEVRFGDTAVSPSSVADTRVTATSPPRQDAGEVPVTVTTPGGTSAAVPFTYVVPPAPTISAIDPASGPTAGGTTVTLTGANLAGASEVRFGDATVSPSSVADTRVTATSPPRQEPGEVAVTVTTPGGTSAAVPFTYVAAQPGEVTDLAAEAVSGTEVRLTFSAPAVPGGSAPATRYVIKRSTRPITADTFDNARSVCDGGCEFSPRRVGSTLTLPVTGLRPETTYHFALKPLDDAGSPGLLSNVASVTTGCGPTPQAGDGELLYPAGYALVGLPDGTRLPSLSPLYGWLDQGAGGAYRANEPTAPVTAGHGYWAYFPCPRLVELPAGADAAPAELALPLAGYHASMVGNPSTRPVTVTGHDYAARWDPTLNGGAGGYHLSAFQEPQTLAVGEGIWVFAYTDTTIVLRE